MAVKNIEMFNKNKVSLLHHLSFWALGILISVVAFMSFIATGFVVYMSISIPENLMMKLLIMNTLLIFTALCYKFVVFLVDKYKGTEVFEVVELPNGEEIVLGCSRKISTDDATKTIMELKKQIALLEYDNGVLRKTI